MDLSRIEKLAGVKQPLVEGKLKELKLEAVEKDEYEDSSDFDHAFSNLSVAVDYAVKVMRSKAFVSWMKASSDNLNFKYSEYTDALNAVEEASGMLTGLYDELTRAGEE